VIANVFRIMLCDVFVKQSESDAAVSCLSAQQLHTMHLLQQSQVLSALLSVRTVHVRIIPSFLVYFRLLLY